MAITNVICTDGRRNSGTVYLKPVHAILCKIGSISAFWTRTRDGAKVVNEIDIAKTFGEDKIKPNLHTWGSAHTDHGSMDKRKKYKISSKRRAFL